MEALETDGTTTGAEDLTWRTQRNAISPYAKQKFPRERAETRWRAGPNARALSASGERARAGARAGARARVRARVRARARTRARAKREGNASD